MTDDHAEEPESMRDQLRAEAATWFARMRGEDAEQHRAAFERWLARGAVHRAAYNRIGEVFAAGKGLKSPSLDAPARVGFRSKRRWAVGLVAAGVCAAIAVPLLTTQGSGRNAGQPDDASRSLLSRERMTTDRVRTFPLANGASVLLDTDSLLVAQKEGRSSVYRLVRGRGRFLVSGSRGTQQVVLAGPAIVTSAGGVFDLWLRSDGSLDTQALRGHIGLRQAVDSGFAADPARTADAVLGRHYRMTSVGHLTILADALGRDWPRGILEFRGTLLRDVVEEANRYGAVKIVLGEVGLGQVRVSGRFRIDEPSRLAERLATVLDLQRDLSTPGLIVLRRAKKIGGQP